jgi:hypothetical protein
VNTVVRVVCNARMASITVQASVYYNNGIANTSPRVSVPNSATARTNVAVPCRPGRYRGHISSDIKAPPGFFPATAAPSGFGHPVEITC